MSNGLPLSVYGGGHGVTARRCVDDGVCIDLRGMKGVEVDPEARTARVEGGVTWGEVDAGHPGARPGGDRRPHVRHRRRRLRARAAAAAGSSASSASPATTCSRPRSSPPTGARSSRRTTENPELFWGLRGGGGNFGVVTAFHFRCTRSARSCSAGCSCTRPRWRREVIALLPRLHGRRARRGRRRPRVPHRAARGVRPGAGARAARGRRSSCCYAGPVEDGEAAFAPLREFGPRDRHARADAVRGRAAAPRRAATRRACRTTGRPTSTTICPTRRSTCWSRRRPQPVSPMTQIILVPGGGAVARVDEEATAFGQRQAPWNIHYLSMWADPADDRAQHRLHPRHRRAR